MVILRKPQFLQFFAFFFQMSDIISDVITFIVRILEILPFCLQHYKLKLYQLSCQNHIPIRIYTGGGGGGAKCLKNFIELTIVFFIFQGNFYLFGSYQFSLAWPSCQKNFYKKLDFFWCIL